MRYLLVRWSLVESDKCVYWTGLGNEFSFDLADAHLFVGLDSAKPYLQRLLDDDYACSVINFDSLPYADRQALAEPPLFPEGLPDEHKNVRRRGRPRGTPGGGRYGCKTKVVRVPVDVAANIDKILASFEDVKRLVDAWENEIDEDIKKQTSPRYVRAKKLLCELRSLLGN